MNERTYVNDTRNENERGKLHRPVSLQAPNAPYRKRRRVHPHHNLSFCTDTCLLVDSLHHSGSRGLERCNRSQNKYEVVPKEAPHHLPEENGGTQQAVGDDDTNTPHERTHQTQLCGARDKRVPSTSSTVSSANAVDEYVDLRVALGAEAQNELPFVPGTDRHIKERTEQ